MCLIAFNWNNHPEYKLILVANRDEFFDRPSEPLHQWKTGIYAGKDLKAGGTWLGMHPSGRFAAITNYRDFKIRRENPISRGNLVRDYLEGEQNPEEYLIKIEKNRDRYEGFNLLVGNSERLYYYSNNGPSIQRLNPGIYGVSNALLDSPWRKVNLAKASLKDQIKKYRLQPEELIASLQTKTMEIDHLLPDTGVPREMEKKLSAQFVNIDDNYGTVNTSIILWKHSGEVHFQERTFYQREKRQVENREVFQMTQKGYFSSKEMKE